MENSLDETELARLVDLYNKAESEPWNPLDDQDYIEAACNAVPALVAEVRRLREEVEAWSGMRNAENVWNGFLRCAGTEHQCAKLNIHF